MYYTNIKCHRLAWGLGGGGGEASYSGSLGEEIKSLVHTVCTFKPHVHSNHSRCGRCDVHSKVNNIYKLLVSYEYATRHVVAQLVQLNARKNEET